MDHFLDHIHHLAEIEDYKTLLRAVGSCKPKPNHMMTDREQVAEIYFLKAMNELGAYETALKRYEKLPESIKQKHMRSLESIDPISEQIEDALSKHDFIGAKQKIDHAFTLFKIDSSSRMKGRIQALLAKYYALTENYSLARPQLDQAFKILSHKQKNHEDELKLVFIKGLIHFLETNELSEDWIYLLTYPSSKSTYLKQVSEYVNCPENIMICSGVGDQQKLSYDLFYETKTIITEIETQHALGFDLLDRAIILLVLTQKFGITQLRLQETLWPNEHFSLLQSTQKIGQLITRLRKKGFKITWKSLHLKLECSPPLTCHWSPKKGVPGGSFLKLHPCFTRGMVQSYFRISKTSALTQISKWLTGGHIQKSKSSSGFLTQYEFFG